MREGSGNIAKYVKIFITIGGLVYALYVIASFFSLQEKMEGKYQQAGILTFIFGIALFAADKFTGINFEQLSAYLLLSMLAFLIMFMVFGWQIDTIMPLVWAAFAVFFGDKLYQLIWENAGIMKKNAK